tara:strand:+ start:554 stop:724 length:171 start_codon:yes stop_codon:yes gene_type:complete
LTFPNWALPKETLVVVVEVVVEEELELSFLEQVIMVKQKSDISIMCNILFIFFLNQ